MPRYMTRQRTREVSHLLEQLNFYSNKIYQLIVDEDAAKIDLEKKEAICARFHSRASSCSCQNARSILNHTIQERLVAEENRDIVLAELNKLKSRE